MESPSKKDKDSMIDKKAKTPETMVKANAEKQKNTSEKTRSGFWSRLKNFTAEPPKTVIIENGVEKLVLITPKTTAIPKTVLPKEETQKPVSVSQETIIRKEFVGKPAPASQEAIVREKPIEKPIPAPQETVVREKPVKEKPIEKASCYRNPLKSPTKGSSQKRGLKGNL